MPAACYIDVVTHTIDGQHYVVLIRSSARRIDIYRQLGRWAADPRLNFTWADASIVGKKLHRPAKASP